MESKFEDREWVLLENEGMKIFGVLHKPLGKEKVPAILICHGFAGNKCGRHGMYVNLAKRLSKNGIAVLRIDFRGSGDSEGSLPDMSLETEVSDALLGLKYLENLPYVDPSRIGLMGRSLGGAVAVITASRYKNTKSLSLWAPVFHAEQWKNEWKAAQIKLSRNIPLEHAMRFNGHVAGREFVKQIFEMRLDHELKQIEHVPLLHIHGEKDNIVSIEHADHYLRCREHVIGKTRFVRLPHGDHDFTVWEAQEKAMEETTLWFQETL